MARKKTESAKKRPALAGKKEAQTIKAATHTGTKTPLPKRKTITPAKEVKALKAQTSTFPIVGIGASAGGLEALEGFFGCIPDFL